MRYLILLICIAFNNPSFSQSKSELKADHEMQEYFKNYAEFNLDALKNKKFTKEVNILYADSLYERQRDIAITEAIYNIAIELVDGNSMEYKVHVFSKNDSIFGLVNYTNALNRKNHYFDAKKLQDFIDFHNEFYQSEITITDFVNQISANRMYGYDCGIMPENYVHSAPEHENLKFDDKKNVQTFRNWLKSFDVELQSYGVNALKYLEKNKGVKLSDLDKKLISNITKRNSVLYICSGCTIGMYEKIFQ